MKISQILAIVGAITTLLVGSVSADTPQNPTTPKTNMGSPQGMKDTGMMNGTMNNGTDMMNGNKTLDGQNMMTGTEDMNSQSMVDCRLKSGETVKKPDAETCIKEGGTVTGAVPPHQQPNKMPTILETKSNLAL